MSLTPLEFILGNLMFREWKQRTIINLIQGCFIITHRGFCHARLISHDRDGLLQVFLPFCIQLPENASCTEGARQPANPIRNQMFNCSIVHDPVRHYVRNRIQQRVCRCYVMVRFIQLISSGGLETNWMVGI
jgi:hypothetical protein